MQGQLFLVQLKPISIIMCAQCTMRGLDEDMLGADRELYIPRTRISCTQNKINMFFGI